MQRGQPARQMQGPAQDKRAEGVRGCRMGTHPSGPSLVVGGEGLTLKDWISQHLSVLGDARHVFGPDLPFLFKACPCAPSPAPTSLLTLDVKCAESQLR